MKFLSFRIERWRLAAWLMLAPTSILAQPLTEAQSVQLGLEQQSFQQLLESQEASARGSILSAKRWANPQVELSHEDAGDETETGLWLRQSFDISGKRQLKQKAAEKE